jgi:cytochrome c oxidase subunit 2
MTRRLAAGETGRALTMALRSLLLMPLLLIVSSVAAGAVDGQAVPWQLGLQEPATEIARQIHGFHNFLLVIITLISLFVMALLVYIMLKFNEKANPVPSKVTHNTVIEVVWTVVPILILLVIAIPSFRLLFAQYDFPKPDVTIKAVGNQWFWTYQYPDEAISFDSLMLRNDDYKPVAGPNGEPRDLAVDNYMVVPVNKNVEVLLTANDVIHSWAVPAFGVKVDAVPGRAMRAWFRAEREGTFYGQCSELCGKDHAFMPIGVRVVSDEVYQQWLQGAKKQFGVSQQDDGKTRVAQAATAAR